MKLNGFTWWICIMSVIVMLLLLLSGCRTAQAYKTVAIGPWEYGDQGMDCKHYAYYWVRGAEAQGIDAGILTYKVRGIGTKRHAICWFMDEYGRKRTIEPQTGGLKWLSLAERRSIDKRIPFYRYDIMMEMLDNGVVIP